MEANKNKIIPFGGVSQVDLVKLNKPGIYFLFNNESKLIYIGESNYPMIRICDHYFKHYKKARKFKMGYQQKGIGPVFSAFRIIPVLNEDKRIRQHYEKRYIKKFNPELNYNSQTAPYDLTCKEIRGFIQVYEKFFKEQCSWHRYLNEQVLKQRNNYRDYKNVLRRRRYIATGR